MYGKATRTWPVAVGEEEAAKQLVVAHPDLEVEGEGGRSTLSTTAVLLRCERTTEERPFACPKQASPKTPKQAPGDPAAADPTRSSGRLRPFQQFFVDPKPPPNPPQLLRAQAPDKNVKIESEERPLGVGEEGAASGRNGALREEVVKTAGVSEADAMPGIRMENGSVGADMMAIIKQEGYDAGFGNEKSASLSEMKARSAPDVDEIIGGLDGQYDTRNNVPSKSNGQNGTLSEGEGKELIRSNPVASFDDLPPEITHITEGYQPIAKLIERLAQDTWKNLVEVIEAMADMHISPHHSGPGSSTYLNNHTGLNGVNSSPMNTQKKMRLLNLVKHKREQFIKVLVLAQWSRQAADVSKVIDLKVWLDRQQILYADAGFWMGELKRNLAPAKMPNPDLKTALEVLSTGKASWLPDLGYILPKPLTPRQMLKTLHEINTLLHLRLNIHEHDNLPAHFKTYSIASGRATFVVPGEFEVDLSIADEDPTSQLYFIDFRLLFTPGLSEVPAGRLRDEIETKANDALKRDGLAGCYHFLHDLVLTDKINVLRRQTMEMARGKWNDTIKLESVRRSIVVQYWLYKPGGKNWIEIGIMSGKVRDKNGVLKGEGPSRIGVRWFREGKEVKDPPIVLHFWKVSMEEILKHVIALHTKYILTSIRDRLVGLPLYAQGSLSLSLTASTVEPADSNLKAQLTPSRTLTATIEPITGYFALQPPSLLFSSGEVDLNKLSDPASEAAACIRNLRCLSAQDEIESRARSSNWEPFKSFNPKATEMKRIFPRDTLRVSFFRRKTWSTKWLIAVSVGMSGEDWWVIELLEARISYTLGESFRIPIASPTGKATNPSYEFFSRLEKMAAGLISTFVNSRHLSMNRAKYSLESAPTNSASFDSSVRIPLLFVQFSSLMNQKSDAKLWAKDVLKLSYQGLDFDGKVITIVEAQLKKAKEMTGMKLVSNHIDEDVAFSPARGLFALRCRADVGEPVIKNIVERLKRIERLIQFIGVVQASNLPCERVTLGRIVFSYSVDPPLKADIGFAGDIPMTISLEKGNPHLRVKDFLVGLLNAEDSAIDAAVGSSMLDADPAKHISGERSGFYLVTKIMNLSLPLLLAIDEIEARHGADEFCVLARAADCLQIDYRGNLACKVEITLRQRRDEYVWFVTRPRRTYQTMPVGEDPEKMKNLSVGIHQLFTDSGEGWMGLKTGISATRDGVAEVIKNIDDLMWKIVVGDAERKTIDVMEAEARELIEQEAERREKLAKEKKEAQEKAVAEIKDVEMTDQGSSSKSSEKERTIVVLD